VGLGVDVAAIGGWRGDRVDVALAAVLPATVGWQDGVAWRLPARLEALVRTVVGPVTLGLRLGGGMLWGGDAGAAIDLRAGVVLGFGSTAGGAAEVSDLPASLPVEATSATDPAGQRATPARP